jgi:nitronate monooxygenase
MSEKLKPLKIGNLEIEIPIIQGGMGVQVSTAPLASTVANCGGAGTIASVGLGYGTPENETDFVKASRDGLIDQYHNAKITTKKTVGVNIMVALSNYLDLVQTADSLGFDFIVSGAGLPLDLPRIAKNTKILIPIVSSSRAAKIIIKKWAKQDHPPDAIIVEGPLAGGHLGFKPECLKTDLSNVLEEIVGEVIKVACQAEEKYGINIPVIAAGGIFDGKDIARLIKMGARGVQIATRFVATYECSVADAFKQLYLSASDGDVLIIDSPVGMPGRAIRTPFTDKVAGGNRIPFKCNYKCLRTCNPHTAPYCIARALFNAVSGDLDNAVVFAGSNVSRIDKIVSVKELMDELVTEAIFELKKD